MSRRHFGKVVAGSLLHSLREWIAGIGGLGGGLGAGILVMEGWVGSVPGVVGLVLAACALVAAFFGMRDRDLGGWAGAFVALVLGIATFVALGLASGT